jgi:hypothetical protein
LILEVWRKKLIPVSTKLRINAHKKPFTINPGTILAVKRISPAFITNVKRPRVIILRGRVKSRRIGLMIALITPRAIATTSAVVKLETETPGKT